jgi:hypothetical protein
MRNASIVAPLLLIGIGALFLARNVFPDLPLLDYLALYWPYILILWGTLRLLEVAIWTATGRALPRAGVSGGEWILVVFLCIMGMSLHAARGFTTWLPRAGVEWGGLEVFGESYDYPLSGEAMASAAPRVVIENFRGSARIVGATDNSTTVKVTGKTQIRSIDRSSADRASNQAVFEVSGSGNQIVINPHQDRVSGIRRVSADMDIVVPKGASIVAHGHDGDFSVSGIVGSVDIDGRNSSVRLEEIGGEVRLDIQGSDLIRAVALHKTLDLKGNGTDLDLERIAGQVTINGYHTGLVQWRALSGPVHWRGPQTEFSAQSLPGDLRMTTLGDIVANGITGPVHIDSQTKDISLTDFTDTVDVKVGRGDVKIMPLRPALSRVTVTVNSGNVEFAVPESAHFDLNATTNHGDGVNDFGTPFSQDSTRGGGATIRGSNGGPMVSISVQRGQIQLRKSSPGEGPVLAPVAPTAPRAASPKTVRVPDGAPPKASEQ